MFGVGLPVALQYRVTLFPSTTTVLQDELLIAAGSIGKNEEESYNKVTYTFDGMTVWW